MSQKRARHLGEGAFDQVEPRTVPGRMNVLEAPRARAQKGHGLIRDVGRVVVQHHADDCIFGVVRVDLLEQSDELNAAVTVLDIGKDVSGMQVDASHDRDGAVANILVVTPLKFNTSGT